MKLISRFKILSSKQMLQREQKALTQEQTDNKKIQKAIQKANW